MRRLRHRWNLTPRQAIALQARLRGRVVTVDRLKPVRFVGGVDVGFEDGGATTRAAVAVLAFPALELVDCAVVRRPTRFPYVPGLLSFRETPAILAALGQLRVKPDLVLCDGHGLAHPRRFGIACHLGLLTGIPTVGIAKSRLTGVHRHPANRRGAWTALKDGGERIGAVVRTRADVKPVYVSIGHAVSLKTAIRYALACAPRYRLPETTRWAHRLASSPRRELDSILARHRARAR